jgi:hypothetical protein
LFINQNYPLSLSDFNENWISRQIFEKYSKSNFMKNPSGGRQVFPCGRTDGHDETNSHFSHIANAPEKKRTNLGYETKPEQTR